MIICHFSMIFSRIFTGIARNARILPGIGAFPRNSWKLDQNISKFCDRAEKSRNVVSNRNQISNQPNRKKIWFRNFRLNVKGIIKFQVNVRSVSRPTSTERLHASAPRSGPWKKSSGRPGAEWSARPFKHSKSFRSVGRSS